MSAEIQVMCSEGTKPDRGSCVRADSDDEWCVADVPSALFKKSLGSQIFPNRSSV